MSWTKLIRDGLTVLVSTVVILFIINVLSIGVMQVYSSIKSSDRYSTLPAVVKENYSHLSISEVNSLLSQTWTVGWEYEEILGFKEKPRTSEFVNVNSFGFRSLSDLDEFESLLEDSIWFFGGSTTFGYGVADNETIPSQLALSMNERVVNLGRGYYFSEQENLLLLKLLKSGFRPSKAIFLNGLNERCTITTYQEQMRYLFESAQQGTVSLSDYLMDIVEPSLSLLYKVASKIGVNLLALEQNQSKNLHGLNCNSFNHKMPLGQVVSFNLDFRKNICERYSIDCLTFLQPFAGVHGTHLSTEVFDLNRRERLREKYQHLKPIFEQHNAYLITDALDDFRTHAFVDPLHYSSSANLRIAEAIELYSEK